MLSSADSPSRKATSLELTLACPLYTVGFLNLQPQHIEACDCESRLSWISQLASTGMEIAGDFNLTPPLHEPSFEGMCEVTAALNSLATSGREERGAVFTKPEVANFILDLVGYREDRPLPRMRFLEPSFGNGDFLLMAIRRLLNAPGNARALLPPTSPAASGALNSTVRLSS